MKIFEKRNKQDSLRLNATKYPSLKNNLFTFFNILKKPNYVNQKIIILFETFDISIKLRNFG
jgi:flagellar motor switch protein FliG